jgi:hypothetical protein
VFQRLLDLSDQVFPLLVYGVLSVKQFAPLDVSAAFD